MFCYMIDQIKEIKNNDNTRISRGAVVTKDVEPNIIVGGAPAKGDKKNTSILK